MSGIFSRTQYDECYSDEYKRINEPASNYSFYLGYNVNPNMKQNMSVCVDNIIKYNNEDQNCYVCNLNKEATLNKIPENFLKITEIDNDLKGINRHLTYCNDKKFQGCFSDAEKNNIIINPQLCDRVVVPTNMKKFENILY
jgi:hypothetical protein